ncbi:MAG: MGMT family protein, partial [Candidatus Cloacimonetes bacterium]|nr:MGMT family protein [Candidatus Cloacimonadota bacterium]
AIIIPCHRVIAKSGEIGGFAVGKEIKRMLLAIEHKCGESL